MFGGWLKQSTAVTLKIGPFVDETDGFTAETLLTISQADVRLSKNGGNMAQKNEASSATHDEIGIYDCPLDTTDTNTLGLLDVMIHESGARPVRQSYMVVPAQIWDSMVGGSDTLAVDISEINGDTVSTPRLALAAAEMLPGTVDDSAFSPTTTEFEADDITEATADHFNGRTVIFTSGALQYQARQITDYALSGANGHFTVDALTEAPANDVTFIIV